MSRGVHTFTQSAAHRALKAAKQAGLMVKRLDVNQDGSVSIVINNAPEKDEATHAADPDDLDRELEGWRQRHGQA